MNQDIIDLYDEFTHGDVSRRAFLDRLATHILAFEGNGYVHWCEGNFQTYEEQRKRRLGIDADQPHRFKYKKLQH